MERRLTRRAFLGGFAASATTAILAACGGSASVLTPSPSPGTATALPGTAAPASTTASGTAGTNINVATVVSAATIIAARPTVAGAASPGATAAVGTGASGTATPPSATPVATTTTVTPVAATAAAGSAGAVYALTNQEAANAVAIFTRGADGKLTFGSIVPTGGKGVGEQQDGEGLGSQGALAFSQDGKALFAVNGGSGDISSFAVDGNSLTLIEKVPSNGPRPISLTVHNNLLYVLNYNRQKPGTGNITAFTIGTNNRLTPLADSTKPETGTTSIDPGQLLFSPKGDLLALTEKATNKVLTYTVSANGIASAPTAYASGGDAPFSLAFVNDGLLLTADNFGDAAGKGAASSFTVGDKGTLKLVSKAVPDKQTGACWIVATRDEKYAYVVNTGAATISGYRIGQGGALTLLNADGLTTRTGTKPRDIALSRDSRFLYVLNSGEGTVEAFAIQSDGKLESIGEAGKFPAPGANGLIAR
jgi:6-phosphogluconolactonase